MPEHHLQCNRPALGKLLDETLTGAEQTALETHLEQCASCREELEGLAAEASWWGEARQYLDPEKVEVNDDAHAPTETAEQFDTLRPEAVIKLLAPTDDPMMLGRLGGYEIAAVIGIGGMGIVLKGFDVSLNRYVAIKVLSPTLASSAAARQRFAREAQAAAAVVHENVIAIHSVSEADGLPYLVMPYNRGESLEKRLAQQGSLQVNEVLRIAMQAAQGLAAAHAQGLVHRDIKPANILLADGVERVTITDFGLARAVDDASLTRTGVISGTPQYMSPEQARGDSVDHCSDLFSLGSVIYVMCTGRPPFRADTSLGVLRRICESTPRPMRELNSEIPLWLEAVVERLLFKNRIDRYQSAADLAELLKHCLAHLQQPDVTPLPDELVQAVASRRQPSTTRRTLWFVSLAVLAPAVILLVAFAAYHLGAARPSPSEAPSAQTAAEPAERTSASAEPVPAEQPPTVAQPMQDDWLWDDTVDGMIRSVDDEVRRLEQQVGAPHQP